MLKKFAFIFSLFISSLACAERVYTIAELTMREGVIYDNMGKVVNGAVLIDEIPKYNFALPYKNGKEADGIVLVTDKEGNVVSSMEVKNRMIISGFDVRDGKKYPIEGSSLNASTVLVQRLFRGIAGILDPSTRQNKDEGYLLYQAADTGNLEEVKKLLIKGVDVNYVCHNPCQGWTPVMIAAANGHEQVVHYLLENGADSNIQNRFGRTALHYVSKYNFWNIAKDLLEHGANPNLESKNDIANTPVKAALMAGQIDMLQLLLQYGGDKTVTVNGVSILDLANKKNAVELKEMLK